MKRSESGLSTKGDDVGGRPQGTPLRVSGAVCAEDEAGARKGRPYGFRAPGYTNALLSTRSPARNTSATFRKSLMS